MNLTLINADSLFKYKKFVRERLIKMKKTESEKFSFRNDIEKRDKILDLIHETNVTICFCTSDNLTELVKMVDEYEKEFMVREFHRSKVLQKA